VHGCGYQEKGDGKAAGNGKKNHCLANHLVPKWDTIYGTTSSAAKTQFHCWCPVLQYEFPLHKHCNHHGDYVEQSFSQYNRDLCAIPADPRAQN
jgi:hypothetical protein